MIPVLTCDIKFLNCSVPRCISAVKQVERCKFPVLVPEDVSDENYRFHKTSLS